MKLSLLTVAVLGTFAFNVLAAVEVKVCTVFHEKKASACLDKTKQDYPANTLYGVSKISKDAPSKQVTHRWNNLNTEILTSMDNDHIVVSSFTVPNDFSGEVVFAVASEDGQILTEKTYVIKKASLAMSAQEKSLEAPVTEVVAVAITTLPTKAPNLDLEEIAVIQEKPKAPAEKGTPDAIVELEAIKEPPKTTEVKTPSKAHEPVVVPEHARLGHDLGFLWRRVELHGAHVEQKKIGSSTTAIPYWVPEFRLTDGFAIGARVGGTKWKEKGDKTFTGFESDVHVNLSLVSSKGKLTLQPLVGYHSWSKLGNQVSYGGNLVLQTGNSPLSVIAGGQAWKHEKISYQMVNLGIGYDF